MRTKIDRTGEITYNKWGSKMTIVHYTVANDITVEFESGYIVKTQYIYFKKGNIKSPYCKSIFGVGYGGEGQYDISKNGIHTKEYSCWFSMINRCYNTKTHEVRPTYKNCTVCEKWHNFQNFAKWYDENYYEVDNEVMCLDKDILHKGNKIYSSETCVFVPQSINILFTKRQNCRGEYPIGVVFHTGSNMFHSRCNIRGENKHLGAFESPQEAFNVYKQFKEKTIKLIADEYKNKIPTKLYSALHNYKVAIND